MAEISTYPLRLPTSLKEKVAMVARQDGSSINQFIFAPFVSNPQVVLQLPDMLRADAAAAADDLCALAEPLF